MIIDNDESKVSAKANPVNFSDTTVNQVIKVQNIADDNTKIVAQNIAAISEVATNIQKVIYVADTLDKKISSVIDKNYNGQSAVEVIDAGNTKFTASLIADIQKIDKLSNDITRVSSLSQVIISVNGIKAILENINKNMFSIQQTGASAEAITEVVNYLDAVKVINNMKDKLITIFDSINELHTIYNYLPELLQVYAWIVQYKKSQAKNNFTDDEFFTSVIKLIANLESLINLSVNVKDLLAVKKQLDNAPTLLQNIKDELNSLENQYSAKLEGEYTKYKRELGVFVADTKIQIGELLGLLKGTISGSNTGGGTGGGGATVAEVLGQIKQGSGIVISRDLKNDTITISSSVEPFDIDTIKAGDNIKIIKRADGCITINNTQEAFNIKTIKAGANITITDDIDGGITINGQAGGGLGGGDTEIGNFDVVAGWDTNINPSGNENPMVEISGFGNVANW